MSVSRGVDRYELTLGAAEKAINNPTLTEDIKGIYAMTFDYAALAEIYPTRSWKRRAGSVTYKRFEVAAEAVRFAMEELPPEILLGTYLEVEEERFNGHQIRQRYESKDYPLPRKLPPSRSLGNRGQSKRPKGQRDGISSAEVRGLIDRFGTNEKMLDAAVTRLKASR
jgi:hypothetical protein